MVFFESGVASWRKGLVTLHAENRASLKKHVEEQRPAGKTNLYSFEADNNTWITVDWWIGNSEPTDYGISGDNEES